MARVAILSGAAILDTSWPLELYRVPRYFKDSRTLPVVTRKATTTKRPRRVSAPKRGSGHRGKPPFSAAPRSSDSTVGAHTTATAVAAATSLCFDCAVSVRRQPAPPAVPYQQDSVSIFALVLGTSSQLFQPHACRPMYVPLRKVTLTRKLQLRCPPCTLKAQVPSSRIL